jgi:hypothetical protein
MELYSFPYLKGLIVCGADEVAVADIVRPRDLGVGSASEWFALQARQLGKIAGKAGGCEGSEVASNTTLALDCRRNVNLIRTERLISETYRSSTTCSGP